MLFGICFSEVVAYQFLYERDGEVTAVGMAANSHVALVTCKDGMQKDSISVPAAWIAMDTRYVLFKVANMT